MAGFVALAIAADAGHSASRTIYVADDAGFAEAVATLSESGGAIVLRPHAYHQLVVGARSARRLEISGEPGARVGRLLFEGAQRVSFGSVAIAPQGEDAWIEVVASTGIDLHDLLVTARGTRHSASVVIPDSDGVTIRRSTFTHCGDRSPTWSNCVLLRRWSKHLLIQNNWFHDCYGCDFIHGRFGSGLTIRGNRFERALPCHIGHIRCSHQDLIEMFEGQRLRVENNHFGLYETGGAQLYITNAIDHVRIVNNVFVGTDPRVPGTRARIGLIVGSSYSRRLPQDVLVVNNTILTGARRSDGYLGSVRISSLYGGLPRRARPIFANNVFGVLTNRWPVCPAAQASISNVVVRGHACSRSDRVGPVALDPQNRPTALSTLLVDRANRRYAPHKDVTGRLRGAAPDIGAYEFVPG